MLLMMMLLMNRESLVFKSKATTTATVNQFS